MLQQENLADGPIVIAGAQRSGTTLLRNILGGHPALMAHPHEPQFFLELFRRFGMQIDDVRSAVNHVTSHRYCAPNVSPASFDELLEGEGRLSLATFSQAYIQAWIGDNPSGKHPVIKHPALVLHLGLVWGLFPNARVIHMVRDPRANVVSQLNRWPQLTMLECTGLWRRAINEVDRFTQWYPGKIYTLSYEQLLLTPQPVLQELCAFLRVPYSDALLRFDYETASYDRHHDRRPIRFRSLDASRLDQWKQQLTDVEIRIIETACRPEMDRLDYERVQPEVSELRYRARLAREKGVYFVRRMGRAAKHLLFRRKY